MTLNNPYYMYPGYPFSGYNNLEHYNENLINLNAYINKLESEISSKTLLHITCGSAAEELFADNRQEIEFQWQQLFPEHLQRLSKESSMPIIHVIVSNSRMFERDDYKPLFIDNTKEYKWSVIDKNTIRSDEYNIIVKIFNCGMPSECDYTSCLTALRQRRVFDEAHIASLEQTTYDKTYIRQFYQNLGRLFDKVNSHSGFVTCFSWAVFNDATDRGRLRNFHLFREIKSLFTGDYKYSNRLIAEWIYRIGYYNIIINNDTSSEIDDRCISYVNPETLDDDTLERNKLKILEFNSSMSIRTLEKKKKIKKNQEIDSKSPNILYEYFIKYSDIFKDSTNHNIDDQVNQLRYTVEKFIKQRYDKENEIKNYLKIHNNFKDKNFENNKEVYYNYISKNGNHQMSKEIKNYLNIPFHGTIYDIYELSALSTICKINVTIFEDDKHKIFSSNIGAPFRMYFIYDCKNHTYKFKEFKKESQDKNYVYNS